MSSQIHCDWCECIVPEGQAYSVRLVTTGIVGYGEPDFTYAAKLYQCLRCEQIEDDLLDVDGAFERYDDE